MDPIINLIARAVHYTVEIIIYAITIDVILSWIYRGSNVFTNTIRLITEPVLKPFRLLINNSAIGGPGMKIDFSPILAVLFLSVAKSLIISFLYSL